MATKIGARLEAFWLAWKWVLLLSAALAGSLWLNWHQHNLALTAPLRAEIASKDQALQVSATLQAGALATATTLGNAARRASANLGQASDDYRGAARKRPLAPNCAPGQGRVDAVNSAMGAQPPEK